MRTYLEKTLCLVGTLMVLGCGTATRITSGPRLQPLDSTPRGVHPWTALEANDAPEDFHFVVVSDRTGSHREGVFRDAMAQINLLEPAFVVSVGDLIEGYTEDPATLSAEWAEIQGYVGTLRQPFFYAAGNHDMSNTVMAEDWQARFGPSYYAFSYKDVLFLTLNSELFGMVHDPSQSVPGPFDQREQMEWLKKTLQKTPNPRWTIVLIHQPLWDAPRIHPDWLRVEKLLASRPHTVFAGHQHRYVEHRRQNQSYITLATTGGGSDLRGPAYGEFDEVAFVTMAAKGPVIANLNLAGIYPSDIVTTADRERVQALEKSIQPLPVPHSGDSFTTGAAEFHFQNPTDQIVVITAETNAGSMMQANPIFLRQEVPPHTDHTFRVALSGDGSVPYEILESGRINFKIHTRSPDGDPLELRTQHVLQPEKILAIPRRHQAVVIDGDLGEWSDLPISSAGFSEVTDSHHFTGAADAALRFAVEEDGEMLYIAALITDDVLIVDPEKIAREQDGLSIQIDARPAPERNRNKDLWASIRSGDFRHMALTTATLTKPAEDHVLKRFMGEAESPWISAVRKTSTGYAVEFALPLSYIEEKQGADWREIRLNLNLQDTDSSDQAPASLWWRPNRFGPQAVPASGTFQR